MEEAVSETARVQIQARSDGGASSTGWSSSCSWSGGAPRSHQGPQMGGARHREGRSLLIFREMQGNVSLWCSTSGPCLPHEYSEKVGADYCPISGNHPLSVNFLSFISTMVI